MYRSLRKFSLVCVTGAILLSSNSMQAFAAGEPMAGVSVSLNNLNSKSSEENSTISSFALNGITMPDFSNTGIADVKDNLMIRKTPEIGGKILGKLPKNGGCTILEKDNNGWTKIKSGKVTGFVSSEFLITGSEAQKLALKVGNIVATSKASGLNVRKEPSEKSPMIEQIGDGEELFVEDYIAVNTAGDENQWIKVSLDSDGDSDYKFAYVAKQYITLSFELVCAVSIEELQLGSGVSSRRADIVNFAKQYLGNRYVWGGTSLNNGIDCSGFTQAIYRNYGIGISRVSRDQARGGTTISSNNVKPGDLVFYGNNSSGYINHVAMYIGNGQVIHASNERTGIKISNMYYRSPVKCVRYISD